MLEYLRNASDKPWAKFLMGLLIFSFVGWGVAEWVFSTSAGDTTLVKVGNAEIDVQEFTNARSNELSAMSRDDQRAIYTDPAEMTRFSGGVINRLAAQKRAELRADDLGLVVSEHRIADEIRTIPQFQSDGQFSTQAFDVVLANSGYSEAAFANVLRQQVLRSMVTAPTSFPMNLPEFAVTAAYNARYAERNIEYATVKFADFKVGEPSDEELRNFYAQHPHTVAESRSVSYVLVPGKLSAPDEYEKALASAQSVEDDIIAGDSLKDAAKKHDVKFASFDNLKSTDTPDDKVINDKMMSRIFAMDDGVESELLETSEGFVIVRVDKITPEHAAEYETVKDTLVADWRRDARKKLAYEHANEILIDLNKGTPMARATRAKISRTNGAPNAVLVAAYKGQLNSNSIVEGDEEFYVMHIGDEIAPQKDDKKIADLRTELSNTASREISDDYNAFLEREYPMRINQKVYNRYLTK